MCKPRRAQSIESRRTRRSTSKKHKRKNQAKPLTKQHAPTGSQFYKLYATIFLTILQFHQGRSPSQGGTPSPVPASHMPQMGQNGQTPPGPHQMDQQQQPASQQQMVQQIMVLIKLIYIGLLGILLIFMQWCPWGSIIRMCDLVVTASTNRLPHRIWTTSHNIHLFI